MQYFPWLNLIEFNCYTVPWHRAQSVRRTSLRDKTLTTKKDAVEETRLRLKAQEVSAYKMAINQRF